MSIIESLPYDVIEKDHHFEIRKYEEFYLASIHMQDDSKFSGGFNSVFNYIQGENEANKKISMTVPVVSKMESKSYTTSFYVPGSYSYDEIPRPLNANVSIEKEPSQIMAVIRFRGRWTKENFDTHTNKLIEYIEDRGLDIISSRYLFRYNPPIVPFFIRKNEIAFRIDYEE